jgi:hypothetical protein
MEREIWLPLGFTDRPYEVSNYGRIRSFCNDPEHGIILKGRLLGGYLSVDIRVNNKIKKFFIHKLVAEKFVPSDNPEAKVVTHLDFNKLNNYYRNLKWSDFSEINSRYEAKFNRMAKNKKIHPGSYQKLSEAQIRNIQQLIKQGTVQAKIARKYKISEMKVTRIKRKQNQNEF